jgi:hypothetical protein
MSIEQENRAHRSDKFVALSIVVSGFFVLAGAASSSLILALAPIYGICPFDIFRVESSPGGLLIIGWGIVFGAFYIWMLIYSLRRSVWGFPVFLFTLLSSLLLFARFSSAIKGL